MSPSTRTLRRVLLLVALVLTLAVAGTSGVSAKPNKPPAGSAEQCSKGGWAVLAPSTSVFTPFANQKACTTYVSQGGVPVALQYDTDADGFTDGDEVEAGSSPLDPNSHP